MGKRQEAPKGANDFHYENFLRRSRYTTVFLVLVAAFCVITVLNINTGNVDISISKIQYHLEDPSAAYPDGGDSWRSPFSFRIFIADVF